MFRGIGRDLTHAVRALAKARAFTLVCVVSLGIGMALVIAIPYVARIARVPPPAVATEGLVEVVSPPRGARGPGDRWSYPDFQALRESETGVTMTGWVHGASTLTRETPAGVRTDSVPSLFVSANYFTTIGVTLARGGGFGRAADAPDGEPVVVVSHAYWQNHLAADPNIVGTTLTLDGVPHVVAGIAPRGFSGHLSLQGRQLFLPLERYPPLRADAAVRVDRANEWIHIHGRLARGVALEQASAAVSAVTTRLAAQYRATNEDKAGLVVAYDALGYIDRPQIAWVQTVALGLTGAVLVVVCLNISGMMLVRSAMRERELSVRHAIGASRGRLAQHVLSEALVLAGLGGLLGALVIFNAPPVLTRWLDRPLPAEIEEALRVDFYILAFCVGLCLIATLLFGALAAARFSRPVIIFALKDDAGAGGIRAGRVHRAAAALQVAIAVPLMVMSAIALDRVRATAFADLGFASESLYAAPLKFDGAAEANVAFRIRSARDTLAGADGVASATVADGLPLDFGGRGARVSLQADAQTAPRFVAVEVTRVGDRYHETLGIPLLHGRGVTREDHAGGEPVTVISKTLAERLLAGADADGILGRRVLLELEGAAPRPLTIVGVSRDFPGTQMSEARPQLLVPLAQHASPRVFLVARAEPDAPAHKVTAALEHAIEALGPDVERTLTYADGLPLATVVTGVWLRQNSVRDFLVQSTVAGVGGGVILMLAALGIYGVVGLMVATRTREIAVRAALGASRRDVLRMILFDVVKLVLPGVLVGLVLTVALVRLNGDNMGVRLSNAEPLAYVAGAAIAVLVAVLASLAHARRAATVPPMSAMRSI